MEKNVKKAIIEEVVATLKGDNEIKQLTNDTVFSFFSKQPVQGAFIALENYSTTFGHTKDGSYPDDFAFTTSCVADSLTTVEALALRCEELLDGLFISELSSSLRLMSAVTGGDGTDFYCKINFETDL